MKLFNPVLTSALLICFQINVFSYTRIYLISEARINKDDLNVSDICKMEGDNIDKISNLVISPEIYGDSIVDNKELSDFLTSNTGDQIFIFGSGVKIKKNIIKNVPVVKPVALVEKGQMVELSIKKNGITIEMKGKALNSGCENEEINFRLSTGKTIKGKITSTKRADIVL